MRSFLHLIGIARHPAHPHAEALRVVTRKDVQWNRPIFKAPSLPTPQQMSSEIPFAAQFPPKKFRRD